MWCEDTPSGVDMPHSADLVRNRYGLCPIHQAAAVPEAVNWAPEIPARC